MSNMSCTAGPAARTACQPGNKLLPTALTQQMRHTQNRPLGAATAAALSCETVYSWSSYGSHLVDHQGDIIQNVVERRGALSDHTKLNLA